MKRILTFFLVGLIIFSSFFLISCSQSENENENSSTDDDPYAEMYKYYGVDSVPDPEFALQQYTKLKNGELKVAFCSRRI